MQKKTSSSECTNCTSIYIYDNSAGVDDGGAGGVGGTGGAGGAGGDGDAGVRAM